MIEVQIKYVQKNRRENPHERIEFVGIDDSLGHPWKESEEKVIPLIESMNWLFYVETPKGHQVKVTVAERYGRKYLKTEEDGEAPNNLLCLPECPPWSSLGLPNPAYL